MSHMEVIPYCLFTCSLGENKQCHHCCRNAVIRYIQISGVCLYRNVCSGSLKHVTKTIVKLIVDDFNERNDFLMSNLKRYYAYYSIDILTKDITMIAFRLMTCCADEMRITIEKYANIS